MPFPAVMTAQRSGDASRLEAVLRGTQGHLPRPVTKGQMKNSDVLEFSYGDNGHLHRLQQGLLPFLSPQHHNSENIPWHLDSIQGVGHANTLSLGKNTEWNKKTTSRFS